MKRLAPVLLSAATLLMASALLTGCSDDKPEVCNSMDDLKSSVDTLKNNASDLSNTDLSEVQSNLTEVKSNLQEVRKDAKAQFATEIDTVDQAESTLESSITAATQSPDATTIAAVVAAISQFGTSLNDLDDAVQ